MTTMPPPPPKPAPAVFDRFVNKLGIAYQDPNSKHIKGDDVAQVRRWLRQIGNDNDPHVQEKARIDSNVNAGKTTNCRSCGQRHGPGRHTISAAQARNLLTIYRATKDGKVDADGFLHVIDLLSKDANRARSVPRLRHWGLLERHKDSQRTKTTNSAGLYRITQKGIDFVEGRIRVPKAANIYLNRLHSFSEETVSIHEALTKEFDYAEHMAGYFGDSDD